ncbi:MAG: helix-turn-helix transcriptional regulator, partial [Actinomycetota bacterium]|nr:helix-turn-helix transcriptional regulator [Actinomycetota bacterium]
RDLRAGVAALASSLGEHRVALDRWVAFAPLATRPEARFEALLEASKAAFELGWEHAGRSHDLLAEAMTYVTDEEARVRALAHEARIVLWLDHRTSEGAAIARDAVRASQRLAAGPRRNRARLEALQAAQQAAMQAADGEEILRLAEEMVSETRGGPEDAYVDALFARAVGEFWTCPLSEVEQSVRGVLDQATRLVLPTQASGAGEFLASVLHDRGRLAEAEGVLETARQLAARIGDRQPSRMIGHELRLVREGPAVALEEYVRAIDALPDPHVRIIPRHVAARFLSRAGGRAAAAELVSLLARAEEDAAAAACPRCEFELHLHAAATLARVERHGEGEAHLHRAAGMNMGRAFPALRLHARALVASGRDPTAAAGMLRELCARYEREDRLLELLWTRVDLARAVETFDRPGATELLHGVATAADEIGAVAILRVAERELRRLGARTWRRGRSRTQDGSLSERERQVADLVATGASNPEIAQALFLSRKTVERHVSNVLAKHGVRNRAELAALLAREGEGAPR